MLINLSVSMAFQVRKKKQIKVINKWKKTQIGFMSFKRMIRKSSNLNETPASKLLNCPNTNCSFPNLSHEWIFTSKLKVNLTSEKNTIKKETNEKTENCIHLQNTSDINFNVTVIFNCPQLKNLKTWVELQQL